MVQAIKELVRPIVTVLFAVASVYFTAVKIMPIEAFLILATAAIVWWYKDREAEKIRKENEKLQK